LSQSASRLRRPPSYDSSGKDRIGWKRRSIHALRRALVSLLAVTAAFGVAAPDAARPPDVIAPGVSVAGVGIGGLTSEPARTRIQHAFGRPLGVSYRPRLVQRYVAEVAKRFYDEPVNARLEGLGADGRPLISRERPGRRVATGLLAGSIAHALHTPRRASLRLPTKPVAPAVTQVQFGPVVVIARESKKLTLYDGRSVVRTFRIATGQASYPTPLGTFSIATKQRDPWWYPPPDSDWAQGKEPVPPGPGNPLGTRWMGLTAPLVGIHGTPDAASIGYSASHGCIRMLIPDADWLFDQVELGTPVVIAAA
jgi:lipoprotein-anchoring transpeptidase ErfK/SrfK